MIKIVSLVALTCLMTLSAPQVSSPPHVEITRDEARQLVMKILESEGIDVKSADLVVEDQPDDKDFCGFYILSAYRSSNLGYFAVSRKTAEVWNPVLCIHYKQKRLSELQKSLRKEIGLSDRVYRELVKQTPFCFLVPVRIEK